MFGLRFGPHALGRPSQGANPGDEKTRGADPIKMPHTDHPTFKTPNRARPNSVEYQKPLLFPSPFFGNACQDSPADCDDRGGNKFCQLLRIIVQALFEKSLMCHCLLRIAVPDVHLSDCQGVMS